MRGKLVNYSLGGNVMSTHKNLKYNFLHGMKDGVPIGLGYFAVSFSLGIAAQSAGITPFQGLIMSMLNNASAGEYAGIAAIKANASYIEIALLILIANARYLLMSCSLSQKLSPDLPLIHRMLIGFNVTDEIFGIGIAHSYPLPPSYMYGASAVSIPSWALGTMFGIIAGNMLPVNIVTALSAAIFGMFIAIIIPPCRENHFMLGVILVSFLISSLFAIIPGIASLSESVRIIILTLLIAGAAAIIRPVSDEAESEVTSQKEQEA